VVVTTWPGAQPSFDAVATVYGPNYRRLQDLKKWRNRPILEMEHCLQAGLHFSGLIEAARTQS
jgi:hypothetical protein